jgi:hypothetical protein
MSEGFVLREMHLDNLQAIYIRYDWRIEPSAAVEYIDTRRTLTPLLSGRTIRAVE